MPVFLKYLYTYYLLLLKIIEIIIIHYLLTWKLYKRIFLFNWSRKMKQTSYHSSIAPLLLNIQGITVTDAQFHRDLFFINKITILPYNITKIYVYIYALYVVYTSIIHSRTKEQHFINFHSYQNLLSVRC